MYRRLGSATLATAAWMRGSAGGLGVSTAPGEHDDGGGSSPVGDTSSAVSTEGTSSTNGLHLDPAALARLGTRSLSASSSAFTSDPAGLEHLEHVAISVLEPGDSLRVTDAAGGAVTLPGLASGSAARYRDPFCQRRVSACLIAHANAFGQHVTVALRGPHPGLVWSDTIARDYSLQEDALHSNLLDPDGPPAHAFAGRALIRRWAHERVDSSYPSALSRAAGDRSTSRPGAITSATTTGPGRRAHGGHRVRRAHHIAHQSAPSVYFGRGPAERGGLLRQTRRVGVPLLDLGPCPQRS